MDDVKRYPLILGAQPFEPPGRGPCQVHVGDVDDMKRYPLLLGALPFEPPGRGPCQVHLGDVGDVELLPLLYLYRPITHLPPPRLLGNFHVWNWFPHFGQFKGKDALF